MTEDVKSNQSSSKGILFGTFASIIAGMLGSLLYESVSQYIPALQRAHWTTWFWLGVCVYVLSCMLLDIRHNSLSRPSYLRWLTVPAWSSLKAFGSQPAAKVSYLVLLVVPLLAHFSKPEVMGLPFHVLPIPLNLKLSYFAAWFFALSLIIYSATCPKEIKKINPVEKIKTLNVVLNQISDANIKIEGENDDIPLALDVENLAVRTLCFLFYALGSVAGAIVLFRSAINVFYA